MAFQTRHRNSARPLPGQRLRISHTPSWMYSVSIPVGVLPLAFVGRQIWHWVTKTSKPRFSREAGTSAHATLIRAKDIFQSKIGLGGGIHHPWKIKGVTVTDPEMQDALDAASAEIVDDDFRKFIVTIKEQLPKVRTFTPKKIIDSLTPIILRGLIQPRLANLTKRMHHDSGTRSKRGWLPRQERSIVSTN